MNDSPIDYNEIIFNSKPDAVPYNYRISYKVALLCLILSICCRGDTGSLTKIHMVFYALISPHNMEKLLDFINGNGPIPIVSFDPTVNRLILFAIGYHLVEKQKNSKFKLTHIGKEYADKIINEKNLMSSEIIELNLLSKSLSEKKVNEIIDNWRLNNVENQQIESRN